jgi:hypothetical protein
MLLDDNLFKRFIVRLLAMKSKVNVCHFYHKSNYYADALANLDCELSWTWFADRWVVSCEVEEIGFHHAVKNPVVIMRWCIRTVRSRSDGYDLFSIYFCIFNLVRPIKNQQPILTTVWNRVIYWEHVNRIRGLDDILGSATHRVAFVYLP